eukprot:scaffold282_cov118-Isochrysis_galbana.AAC.6
MARAHERVRELTPLGCLLPCAGERAAASCRRVRAARARLEHDELVFCFVLFFTPPSALAPRTQHTTPRIS